MPIDEDIPYIKGFVKGCEYGPYNYGWVKNANYDVSLYCATECDGGASDTSYECGYVWRNRSVNSGYKEVKASVVGCDAYYMELGRTLRASNAVAYCGGSYAGGFALGNPSL